MATKIEMHPNERLICVGARILEDNKNYFAGGGLPQVAFTLAQRLYAPNITYVAEWGVIDARCGVPAMGGAEADRQAAAWETMNTVFCHAQLGLMDYGLLAALQIDPWGNINSSFVGGDFANPSRRFGGPGGATGIASCCWRTIYLTQLQERKFVEKIDHISSPGYLDGSPGARERAGLPRGTGPYRVVTPEAIFGFDEATRRMELIAVAEDLTVQKVLDNMGFEPVVAEKIDTIPEPSEEEVGFLRREVLATLRMDVQTIAL
jgi:glutaconate CoA-transferase subunit B